MLTFGKLELLGLIEDYCQGLVLLLVPLTLLKHQWTAAWRGRTCARVR